jgi:hypothetical protein
MTINEHFIYMVFLEALIFFIGIFIMWYQSRKQYVLIDSIINNPEYAATIMTNLITGLVRNLKEDKGLQEDFWGLVQTIGAAIIQGVRGGGELAKPVKLKGFARIFEPFINNPQVQDMVAGKIGQVMENAGKAGAKKVAETVW